MVRTKRSAKQFARGQRGGILTALLHCCVVDRLGPAVLSSDGEGKFGECLRDPMPWIDVGAKFVVAAAEVLDEGVSSAYRLAGAQPFETPHGSQWGFQAAVICFDGLFVYCSVT